jgi:hypothetical protein
VRWESRGRQKSNLDVKLIVGLLRRKRLGTSYAEVRDFHDPRKWRTYQIYSEKSVRQQYV